MIEKMDEFFKQRVCDYDEHMVNNVTGCKEGYRKIAKFVPVTAVDLLDLGCGTGLELEYIFKKIPNIKVTGVDLTREMLDELKNKYQDKDITLINKSYFDYELGKEKYDVVISFQTMHHFSHEMKIKLYKKIYKSLKNGGRYIECDYMVIEQSEEDLYFRENKKKRKEQNIKEDEFYHYDTPCTIDNQISMLEKADFINIKMVFRVENTTMIVANKK